MVELFTLKNDNNSILVLCGWGETRMKWQAVVFMIVWGLDIGINLAKHGEKMDRKYDFGVALISCAVEFLILRSAGLFD